jgi:hypothetical protein
MNEIIQVSVAGSQVVIFPASTVPRNLAGDGQAWTPTTEQALEAERRLQQYLGAATPRLPASVRPGAAQRIAATLGRYARQYFGVLWGGRRLLYINCLPVDHPSDWRARPEFFDDGGEAFFHLLYDPESGEFCGLSINGES